MKKQIKIVCILLVGVLIYTGCSKENLSPSGSGGASSPVTVSQREVCGKIIEKDLVNDKKEKIGLIQVSNDESKLYIEIYTFNGWLIKKGNIYAGDCKDLSLIMNEGSVDPALFPYHTWDDYNNNHYVLELDLKKFKGCLCISVHAIVTNGIDEAEVWADGNLFIGEKFGMYFEYCMQICCNGNRTQTQGGWGADPSGNNPGTYLHANFAGAFPAGLTVGCNKTIRLTSAQAVTNFLPQGSTPKVLTANYVNPTNAKISVLAGQVIALKLNVTFDNYDANFDANDTPLSDLVIASGPFVNWTVSQLLAEAEKKLGGCASAYSASQLNNAADAINKNYDNGTVDLYYLNCPDKE